MADVWMGQTLSAWEALAAFASLPKPRRSHKTSRPIEKGTEFYLERKLKFKGFMFDGMLVGIK